MPRFAYLKQSGAGRLRTSERPAQMEETLECVYVRRETVRAVWRQLGKGRRGDVSELTEDLLLRWLHEQQLSPPD